MKVKHLLVGVIVITLIGYAVFYLSKNDVPDTKGNRVNPDFLFSVEGEGKNRLKNPSFAMSDGGGNIFVSDSGNREIKVFSSKGQFKYAFGRDKMISPYGLVLLKNENLLVTDIGNSSLLEYDKRGKFIREWKSDSGILPGYGCLFENRVYISDLKSKHILVFEANGTTRGKIEPDISLGAPQGLTVIGGKLAVGDNGNFNVKVMDLAGRVVRVFDGGPDAAFTTVKGVAADKRGRLFVAETLANSIRIFNIEGEETASFGREGSRPGEFRFPAGLSIDRENRLFVADTENNRIQVFYVK